MIIRTLLIVCFVATGCCGIQAQDKTSDELIKILTAPDTNRKDRKKAAEKLAQRPPSEVLPKILEVQRKHGHTISNWGMDKFDKGYEVSWEQAAATTAGYAWSGNLNNPSYTKQANLLLRRKAPEWEARVLRYAFAVIQAQRAAHPDRLDYGYFIASSLEGYVEAQFAPNQSDPKYKGEQVLKDAFFIETVENALRWWENNKSAYQ